MKNAANASAISETRFRVRRQFHYNAVIEYGDASNRRPCIVWGISREGARISAETVADLPSTFSLLLAENGSVRRLCQVRWRFDNQLAVQFLARELQQALPLPRNIALVD
jgi:PilZ domain-containing protein